MVCLAASPLDWPMGLNLLKLWIDIQPEPNPNIDIAIALRFDMDMNTVPEDLIRHLKTKFTNVYVFKSSLVGTGWPHGCNALEIGAYQWFVENTRSKAVDADYMLICEPDTIPMRPTWLEELRTEAYTMKAGIIGAYFTAEEGCQHINGNCIMHKDFWKECGQIWGVPPGFGWDVYIGKVSTDVGRASRLIWQEYRLGAPDNPWKGDDYIFAEKRYGGPRNPLYGVALQPAMIHGTKSYEGIDAIRKKWDLPKR